MNETLLARLCKWLRADVGYRVGHRVAVGEGDMNELDNYDEGFDAGWMNA